MIINSTAIDADRIVISRDYFIQRRYDENEEWREAYGPLDADRAFMIMQSYADAGHTDIVRLVERVWTQTTVDMSDLNNKDKEPQQ